MRGLLVEVIAILAITVVVLVSVQSCTGLYEKRSIREEPLQGIVESEVNSDSPTKEGAR